MVLDVDEIKKLKVTELREELMKHGVDGAGLKKTELLKKLEAILSGKSEEDEAMDADDAEDEDSKDEEAADEAADEGEKGAAEDKPEAEETEQEKRKRRAERFKEELARQKAAKGFGKGAAEKVSEEEKMKARKAKFAPLTSKGSDAAKAPAADKAKWDVPRMEVKYDKDEEEKKKEARKARFEGTSLPLKPLPGAKVATGGAEKKVEAKSSAPANAVKAKAAPVQGTEYAKLMAKTQLYKQQEAEAKAAAANGGAKRPAEAEDTEALKKARMEKFKPLA